MSRGRMETDGPLIPYSTRGKDSWQILSVHFVGSVAADGRPRLFEPLAA